MRGHVHDRYAARTPGSRDGHDRLVGALHAAVEDAIFTARLADLGGTPSKPADATPAALGAWTKSEAARWTPIIKAAGGGTE